MCDNLIVSSAVSCLFRAFYGFVGHLFFLYIHHGVNRKQFLYYRKCLEEVCFKFLIGAVASFLMWRWLARSSCTQTKQPLLYSFTNDRFSRFHFIYDLLGSPQVQSWYTCYDLAWYFGGQLHLNAFWACKSFLFSAKAHLLDWSLYTPTWLFLFSRKTC